MIDANSHRSESSERHMVDHRKSTRNKGSAHPPIIDVGGGEAGKATYLWAERLYLSESERKLRDLLVKQTTREGKTLQAPRRPPGVGPSVGWKRDVIARVVRNDMLHELLDAARLKTCESSEVMQRECRRRGVQPVTNVELMREALFPNGPDTEPIPPLASEQEVPRTSSTKRVWARVDLPKAGDEDEEEEEEEYEPNGGPSGERVVRYGQEREQAISMVMRALGCGREDAVQAVVFGQAVKDKTGAPDPAVVGVVPRSNTLALTGGENLDEEYTGARVPAVADAVEPWMVETAVVQFGVDEESAKRMCRLVDRATVTEWAQEQVALKRQVVERRRRSEGGDERSKRGERDGGGDQVAEQKGNDMLEALEALAERMAAGFSKAQGGTGAASGSGIASEHKTAEELLAEGASSLWEYGGKEIEPEQEDKRGEYEEWTRRRKAEFTGTTSAIRAHQVLDELGCGKWTVYMMAEQLRKADDVERVRLKGLYEWQRQANKRLTEQLAILEICGQTERAGDYHTAQVMLEKMGRVQKRKTAEVTAREFKRRCIKEMKEANMAELLMAKAQGQGVSQVQYTGGGEGMAVARPVGPVGGSAPRQRGAEQEEPEKKKKGHKGCPLYDGARWGMAGILVPKPGLHLTAKSGKLLNDPPQGWYGGSCAICHAPGHKGTYCPAGVVEVNGVKQCGARHMYELGHFKADGTDAKT